MEVKGHNGTIIFDGRSITIQRKGFLARSTVGKGEKRIPLTSVTAVQWKPAGWATNGYIQFTLPGGVEKRGKFGQQTTDAASDENSVIFTKQQMPKFEELRQAIERELDREPYRIAFAQPPTQPAPSTSDPQETPPYALHTSRSYVTKA